MTSGIEPIAFFSWKQIQMLIELDTAIGRLIQVKWKDIALSQAHFMSLQKKKLWKNLHIIYY